MNNRKIDTKYYEASVKLVSLSTSQIDEEVLEELTKKEAIIYYFTNEKVNIPIIIFLGNGYNFREYYSYSLGIKWTRNLNNVL